jgi:outer membrane protein insertion porin family
MRRLLTIGLCLIGLLTLPTARAFTPFVVEDIRIEGLQRISAGTIFSYLPVKVGERMDNERASASIRALFKTAFFENVRLQRDGDVLVVLVRERPAIASIEFSGNSDIETDQLKESLKTVGLAEGRVFDRSVLSRVEQELNRQYFSRGKYGVKIDTIVTPLERNRVGIAVNIAEGKAARIKELRIVGNSAFDDDDLTDNFELHTSGLLSFFTRDDQYSKPKLAADLESLRSYYLDRGYLNFAIDSTQVSLTPDKKDVYISINIHEGEQYTVKEVLLGGDLVVPEEELRPLIFIDPGMVFSRRDVTNASNQITDRLGNDGYAFANVNAIPDLDEETREVTLTFFVDPGKRVYVRQVNFTGNRKTRDEVLRREMRQMEAAPYDDEKVKLSQVRLRRLGYFDKVDVKTPAVPGTTDEVDMEVEVEEKASGNILAGVGFSQADGIIFNGSISQDNFLGSGKFVSSSLSTSKVNRVASIGYDNPYWTVDGVSRGFNLFYRKTDAGEANVADYTIDRFGGKMTFGVPVNETDRIRFGLGPENLDINTTDETPFEYADYLADNGLTENPERCRTDPRDCETSKFNILKLTASWSRDSRDRAVLPHSGWLQRLSMSVVPWGDIKYYKLEYKTKFYYPIWDDRFIFIPRVDLGWGDNIGDTTALPFWENFYAGGVRTVRGYKDNTLGPKDFNGDAIGGNFRGIAGLDVALPLFMDNRAVRISAFADIGNVFNTDTEFNSDALRYSAGVGVDWLSPIGALYVSLAYPFNPGGDDDVQYFQFSLGQNF